MPVNDQNINKAISGVKNYTANMGGTQMDGALKFSYTREKYEHSPKHLFLLTDGEVSNPKSVIALSQYFSK